MDDVTKSSYNPFYHVDAVKELIYNPCYHEDAVKELLQSLLLCGCCEIDQSSYNPRYHVDAVKLTRACTIPVTTWMLLIARATPLPRGCCETIPFTMWML